MERTKIIISKTKLPNIGPSHAQYIVDENVPDARTERLDYLRKNYKAESIVYRESESVKSTWSSKFNSVVEEDPEEDDSECLELNLNGIGG